MSSMYQALYIAMLFQVNGAKLSTQNLWIKYKEKCFPRKEVL